MKRLISTNAHLYTAESRIQKEVEDQIPAVHPIYLIISRSSSVSFPYNLIAPNKSKQNSHKKSDQTLNIKITKIPAPTMKSILENPIPACIAIAERSAVTEFKED